MTNGDKFREKIAKKSNAGLAEFLVNMSINNVCKYCIYIEKTCSSKCEYGIKTWFDTPCKDNPPADNEPQEAIPTEVRVDLRKVAKEIVGECKKHYPNGCEDCQYGDSSGLCCFKQEPPIWDLGAVDKPTPADNVNHPSHYTFGKIEVIDFIEDKKLGFHLGNAVKYISRAGRKNPDKTVEDLRKAVWYINRQIQRLEGEGND